uniref:Imidazole glycerol phosphate synthase subunit hisH n=1 Tax=Cyanidium caldarium TaxID=2771 RepID=HIS5_CYACA|nr:imidazole glycerol phosphate synthase subunit hisH [Cyanidium caldarium]Q9TLQ8.1 RecName: Full=Imidazole glycerol phosphate synthase subunit hisH; AltName: Full=IGP synthase glutaminase subunit; AltName: Full=IGP synthase subunit hisH; AltName: Full=ImGP synthase subunit hisH; Short=IGPS subunit hisH [Cyanidium caldarium]AAF12883.1 unknown [Cyanidium caldarium]WDB00143.1 imidazole glycerol phosphate synthase subunit hisH [Cyanidium caldarium]
MKNIGIINCGMGNLHSVSNAISNIGFNPVIINASKDLVSFACSALVLPGVGSFDLAIDRLEKKNLIEPVKLWIQEDRPFVGICLGLQLLFEGSDEGSKPGLKIFNGYVSQFKHSLVKKVPHMGWNKLYFNRFNTIDNLVPHYFHYDLQPWAYFVHSYYIEPKDCYTFNTTSLTFYGKQKIVSSISYNNILATQFHPEKSGLFGLFILKRFLSSY